MDTKKVMWLVLYLVAIWLPNTAASLENAASTGGEYRKRKEVEFLASLIAAYRTEAGDTPTTFDQLFRKYPASEADGLVNEPSVRENYAFVLLGGEMPRVGNYQLVRGFLLVIERHATERFGRKDLGRYCIWQLGERIVAIWMHEEQVRQFSDWTTLEGKLPKEAVVSQSHDGQRSEERNTLVGMAVVALIVSGALTSIWWRRSRQRRSDHI